MVGCKGHPCLLLSMKRYPQRKRSGVEEVDEGGKTPTVRLRWRLGFDTNAVIIVDWGYGAFIRLGWKGKTQLFCGNHQIWTSRVQISYAKSWATQFYQEWVVWINTNWWLVIEHIKGTGICHSCQERRYSMHKCNIPSKMISFPRKVLFFAYQLQSDPLMRQHDILVNKQPHWNICIHIL